MFVSTQQLMYFVYFFKNKETSLLKKFHVSTADALYDMHICIMYTTIISSFTGPQRPDPRPENILPRTDHTQRDARVSGT